MRALRLPLRAAGRRCFGTSSVLGTSTLSAADARRIQQDINELRAAPGPSREALRECALRKGELDHIESPEANAAHDAKIERQMASLFSKLPLPADPMKAALAPTAEEAAGHEQAEELREVVRQRYRATLARRRGEAQRIAAAMRRVDEGTYEPPSPSPRPAAAAAQGDDPTSLQRQLEEAQRRIAELTQQLQQQQQQHKPQ